MTAPVCTKYETCSAPLCPLDPASLSNCGWFADEETCTKRGLPRWVLRQRKIARVCDLGAGFFTHKMLGRDCVIRKGFLGLNHDMYADELPQEEAKWLERHPVKPPLSDSEREHLKKMAVMGAQSRKEALSSRPGAPNS